MAVQSAAAAAALARIARGARREPALRPGGAGAAIDLSQVSVVIPARNEAHRLGPCLEALGATGCGEVIVVDDESTDPTAALAAAKGATVVAGRPLPQGWVGKQWALHQGVQAATGRWVVTLDADTRPAPGLLGALVSCLAPVGRYELVSAGGRFLCPGAVQRILHPAMLTTMVYRFGPPGARRPLPPGRAVLNGQCVAFERSWLLARGGYEPVRAQLTEDVALARHLARSGARIGFLDGTGLLEVAMYESASETWREWGRSLSMPDVTGAWQQAGDLAVVWLAQALPLVRVLSGRASGLDAGLVAVRLALLGATRGAYASPGVAYWLSPLADVAAAARLSWTAVVPVRTWRGRTYPA